MKVLFDSSRQTKKFILKAFNKSVSSGGKIVDSDTKDGVLAINGEEVMISEFGGIKKGSELIVKNDIGALVEYARRFR